MSAWLDPVRRALEAVPSATFFFRDDDAGWAQPRFLVLLDAFAGWRVPLDVAVVPMPLTPGIASELRSASAALPGVLELHQHGFAHLNHEAYGRKAEFGASRPLAAQRRDIDEGLKRLRDAVGECVRPFFTPPWNRCTEGTVACLAELGFEVLSRDASAPRANVRGIVEQPIRLDWCGRHGVALGEASWGHAIAGAIRSGGPIGIMLHHAVMADDDLTKLNALLGLLSSHPRASLACLANLRDARAAVSR